VRKRIASWLRDAADRLDGRWTDAPANLQLQAAITSLQLRAWSCSATVRISRVVGNREASWNTASGVLIEFPERAVIATAWHVLEEFRNSRDAGEEVYLVCDRLAMEKPRTAYRDERNDLALIALPPKGSAAIRAIPYRPGPLWPPPPVREGDSVLVCGYPKRFRFDGAEILHGDLNLLVDVASAADSHFMLNIDWRSMAHAGRVAPPDMQVNYGGVSGGPVFRSDGGPNPLVGVVVEAGEELPLWRIASLAGLPDDIGTRPTEPV
jgi:hypothetical protein